MDLSKVALGLIRPWSWRWRFPGILLVAAAVSGLVTAAVGVHQEAGLSAPVQQSRLTSHVSVAARTFPQTITFDQPPGATAGTAVPLSASASSGLPVLFTSDTSPVCTVAGSTVTTVAAGTCTITASQSGGGYVAAAQDVTRSFQVQAPDTPVITFDQPPGVTVGTPASLSASASPPGLPVLFRSDTLPVCTVADSTVTTVAPGTCMIEAFQDGKPPEAAAPVTRSFRVDPVLAGPVPQTITFAQPPGTTAGARVALSAHATSGLPVRFTSDTPAVCTVTEATVTTVAAGPCTITASQSGSHRYAAAAPVTRSFRDNPVMSNVAGPPAGLLAAAAGILVAAAAALTLAVRRWRRPPHPLPTPGLSVQAVPHAGPPRLVSVHTTGTDATHTVCVEPSSGTSIITIEEARP